MKTRKDGDFHGRTVSLPEGKERGVFTKASLSLTASLPLKNGGTGRLAFPFGARRHIFRGKLAVKLPAGVLSEWSAGLPG